PCTVHRAPCTVHRAPCTVHRAPCTVHRAPCTLHPAPCTLHPEPPKQRSLKPTSGCVQPLLEDLHGIWPRCRKEFFKKSATGTPLENDGGSYLQL
ncbi:hypothetical protein T484DRAFT_3050102, partial [Baffinella frigidus]